ncbi:hypothetical protein J6590_041681 [Homalodisca vitripennis]|nr:hypothetical protein J6590_041681 [Homalodisca vitripennis]
MNYPTNDDGLLELSLSLISDSDIVSEIYGANSSFSLDASYLSSHAILTPKDDHCDEISKRGLDLLGSRKDVRTGSVKNCSSKSQIPKDIIAKLQDEFLKKMEETISSQFDEYNSKLYAQIADLKAAVEFCSGKIDEYENKLSEVTSKFKILEKSQRELKLENNSLKQEINKYQVQLECLEQYNRNRNIQIEGVPEIDSENMVETVQALAQFVNVPINYENDIQAALRIPTKKPVGP